jgi:Condensation domain
MNVERVLAELDEKGIHILVKGPNITLGGFQEALEPALLERVIGLKEQIISYLSQKPSEIVGCNLSARHRPDRLPLSYAQERQWLMHQLGQVDTISASVRLRGRLDRAALEWSFAALLQRHEALRTRFVEIEGAPVQVIDAPNAAAMQVEDVSELAREGGALAVLQRVRVVTQQPFDLKQGPLFRVHLLRLSGDEHIAVVTMHHIVSDGWSVGILIREIGALYTAHIQGQPSPLPELTIQYADYVMWQRGWLQGEVLEKQLAYWKDQLSGAPVALELPTDRPRPPVQSYRGQVVSFELSVGLTAGISALARREGATLFMVLLAAFNVVLSRWSGQLDVVVGSPIAGRSLRELEGLIGHFVNLLPLRTDLSRNPSFRALLGRVKDVALGAYPNQDLPFEKLLEELRPVRDLSRQPIFQVLFALQNMQREALQLPGLELSRLAGKQVTAKLDLSLYMQEREGRLEGHLEYAMDMFERSTIGRLAAHLRVLLEGIVANPDTRIGELPRSIRRSAVFMSCLKNRRRKLLMLRRLSFRTRN